MRSAGMPNPADTQRNDDVIITSKRRRFDVIMTLLLRHVPAGQYAYCGVVTWGFTNTDYI